MQDSDRRYEPASSSASRMPRDHATPENITCEPVRTSSPNRPHMEHSEPPDVVTPSNQKHPTTNDCHGEPPRAATFAVDHSLTSSPATSGAPPYTLAPLVSHLPRKLDSSHPNGAEARLSADTRTSRGLTPERVQKSELVIEKECFIPAPAQSSATGVTETLAERHDSTYGHDEEAMRTGIVIKGTAPKEFHVPSTHFVKTLPTLQPPPSSSGVAAQAILSTRIASVYCTGRLDSPEDHRVVSSTRRLPSDKEADETVAVARMMAGATATNLPTDKGTDTVSKRIDLTSAQTDKHDYPESPGAVFRSGQSFQRPVEQYGPAAGTFRDQKIPAQNCYTPRHDVNTAETSFDATFKRVHRSDPEVPTRTSPKLVQTQHKYRAANQILPVSGIASGTAIESAVTETQQKARPAAIAESGAIIGSMSMEQDYVPAPAQERSYLPSLSARRESFVPSHGIFAEKGLTRHRSLAPHVPIPPIEVFTRQSRLMDVSQSPRKTRYFPFHAPDDVPPQPVMVSVDTGTSEDVGSNSNRLYRTEQNGQVQSTMLPTNLKPLHVMFEDERYGHASRHVEIVSPSVPGMTSTENTDMHRSAERMAFAGSTEPRLLSASNRRSLPGEFSKYCEGETGQQYDGNPHHSDVTDANGNSDKDISAANVEIPVSRYVPSPGAFASKGTTSGRRILVNEHRGRSMRDYSSSSTFPYGLAANVEKTSAKLEEIRREARRLGEAEYYRGPGSKRMRLGPCEESATEKLCPVLSKKDKKSQSAYVSRFTAKEYERLLQQAVESAEQCLNEEKSRVAAIRQDNADMREQVARLEAVLRAGGVFGKRPRGGVEGLGLTAESLSRPSAAAQKCSSDEESLYKGRRDERDGILLLKKTKKKKKNGDDHCMDSPFGGVSTRADDKQAAGVVGEKDSDRVVTDDGKKDDSRGRQEEVLRHDRGVVAKNEKGGGSETLPRGDDSVSMADAGGGESSGADVSSFVAANS